MCAIAGIYAYHTAANPVEREELIRIRDHMAARGPDGEGAWFGEDDRVTLGHRRLSIIDLSERAAQPMASADGRHVITFNGEIYNYKTLRRTLEDKGHVFRTQSDTEVLLHLYTEKGEAMVHDLRGMFAFAIWDNDKHALLLARDPYGIKPLYYADDGWTLRFASQVKALVAGGRVSREPEPAGWVGFYLLGSVPEPFTIYREIRVLPAGSTLWVDRVEPREPQPFFSVAETYARAEQSREQGAVRQLDGRGSEEAVREALLESVRHHLVADVAVGAFLSAGIDSGALVGLMRDCGGEDIQTVTLAFEEFRGRHDDEAPLAEEVARKYGTRHTTRVVTEAEFSADLPRILDAMDQPTIDGINTWFVSKAARELGLKVAISGLGGDELFGGYDSFRDIPRWVRWLAAPARVPLLGEVFRHAASALAPFAKGLNPKAAGLLKYGGSWAGAWLLRRGLFMPWELGRILDPEMVREGLRRLQPLRHIAEAMTPRPRTAFGKVASLESALYMRNQLLRDTDWASMAHSLEVRVPLVDAHLLHRLAPIMTASNARTATAKAPLVAAPSRPLPAAIATRAKTGFSTPVAEWLKTTVRFQAWRRLPALAAANCPWARRWAVGVASPT